MSKIDEVKAEIEKLNKEHEEKIAELMATLKEPKEKEYKRWRAKKERVLYSGDCGTIEGEPYFYLASNGAVVQGTECGYLGDDHCYATGNYFKTKEEAELHRKKLIAYQTIKDDTKGFEPDWEDGYQPKWYGYYGKINGLAYSSDHLARDFGAVYFKTEWDIRESQKKHEAEWKLLLGVEDEADR